MPKHTSPSGKPPLAESRLRPPRRILRSSMTSIHTPPGSLTKTRTPNRFSSMEEPDLRPEYRSISCELQALAQMVKEEFGNHELGNVELASKLTISPFERGRFYDEYSARRNERLRKKRGETTADVKKTPYNLGVTVESGKKRGGGGGESKKLESLRKSVPANFTITRSENTRYSLRSSTKENKKPTVPSSPAAIAVDAQRSSRISTRRVRKL